MGLSGAKYRAGPEGDRIENPRLCRELSLDKSALRCRERVSMHKAEKEGAGGTCSSAVNAHTKTTNLQPILPYNSYTEFAASLKLDVMTVCDDLVCPASCINPIRFARMVDRGRWAGGSPEMKSPVSNRQQGHTIMVRKGQRHARSATPPFIFFLKAIMILVIDFKTRTC